ncbi:alkaline phosphatase [Helicobacter cappadocius]|uniref:Alkaline phosphatase n=1 Tax=Helicobacter cappadocius TaxID=3063998 RepID=A0AA90PKS7_9HELI|nr:MULTISPECIES: alkaline phosphatase [unclassified Helicobacter]MDO7252871.1 alkaline phosphatase [Helicobacter sp. faydin-H75]MDP2538914.1 alkaline phosphatase [Helicobacter sp. faydin-H76]
MKNIFLIISVILFGFVCFAAEAPSYNRHAKGDITKFGGARRITGDQTQILKTYISNRPVKNVILLIGDGMGDSEITIARNYYKGAGGFLDGIDAFPFSGQYTHYSLDKKTHKPNYVTDSAASATAWSTGVKTYNGALGIDVYGKPHKSLIELAKSLNKATGNITTAEIQDATPAAQMSHISSRKCYGVVETRSICPEYSSENNGAGSITEQILKTRPDIVMGGGLQTFFQKDIQNKTLMQEALDQNYQVVKNLKELEKIKVANDKKPLLGLFAQGNMPTLYTGPKAIYHGNIDEPPIRCQINPDRKDSIPTLAQMTQKAIELLSKNKNGFFLQIEGASIDKQNHLANPCGQIGESIDLDEAVQVALKFARENPDTLVILTADHGHSSQIISNDAKAPGLTRSLITEDGSIMTVSYGNSETQSQGHTGTQLRIAAFGPMALNFTGLLDQTDLFFIISDALGLNK